MAQFDSYPGVRPGGGSAGAGTHGNSRVMVLGVGSPVIDAGRSGTSLSIIANGTIYVFDAGPGVERRLMQAQPQLSSLGVRHFGPIFITHLHNDHTLGLATLYRYHQFSPPGHLVITRAPFAVFGPPGISSLMNHLVSAFSPRNPVPVNTREIGAAGGEIYRDPNIVVEAFPVVHKGRGGMGSWFGYRVQVGGRVIVISGDTRPVDTLVAACSGCDILFHEVYGLAYGPEGPVGPAKGHTSAAELGEIARRANPKLLVLYHYLPAGAGDALLEEVAKTFKGPIVLARDLDMF